MIKPSTFICLMCVCVWVCSDFQSFFSFQLITAKVFPYDMTHFNISSYLERSTHWAHQMCLCVCGIWKSRLLECTYHFTLFPTFNDICMLIKPTHHPAQPHFVSPREARANAWNNNGNSNGTQHLTWSQIHFHFLFRNGKNIYLLTISVGTEKINSIHIVKTSSPLASFPFGKILQP